MHTYHMLSELWGAEKLNSQHERELNRSEGSGMLIGDPLWCGEQCWLDQPGEHEATVTAPESGELNSQHERELSRSEGSGMLISDPLW